MVLRFQDKRMPQFVQLQLQIAFVYKEAKIIHPRQRCFFNFHDIFSLTPTQYIHTLLFSHDIFSVISLINKVCSVPISKKYRLENNNSNFPQPMKQFVLHLSSYNTCHDISHIQIQQFVTPSYINLNLYQSILPSKK